MKPLDEMTHEELLAEVAAHREAAKERAKGDLRDFMREISEDCYCAGWMSGLEFDLWDFAKKGVDKPYGLTEMPASWAVRLQHLSELCGGWWCWKKGEGEIFIPMAEWERIASL